jgi:hypothetical protein
MTAKFCYALSFECKIELKTSLYSSTVCGTHSREEQYRTQRKNRNVPRIGSVFFTELGMNVNINSNMAYFDSVVRIRRELGLF